MLATQAGDSRPRADDQRRPARRAGATRCTSAGLHRLTVSLDTLQPDRFQALTRFDALPQVLAGIDAASQALRAASRSTRSSCAASTTTSWCRCSSTRRRIGAEVRFIEYMDVGGATQWSPDRVVSRAGDAGGARHGSTARSRRSSKTRSAPADRFRLPDGTIFGIISSTTEPFCRNCDRSRLTADGMWYLCLYATSGTDLRTPLRAGMSQDDLLQLITTGVVGARRSRRRGALGACATARRSCRPVSLKKDPHLEMHTRGG